MSNYKEIVTKTVIGKAKKTSKNDNSLFVNEEMVLQEPVIPLPAGRSSLMVKWYTRISRA